MAINILNRFTGATIVTVPVSTLVGFDFAGLNIPSALLSNIDLTGAKFGGCNASGSTFQNSICSGTDFSKGNVQGSDFRGITRNAASNFHQCYFEDVVLDVADQNVGGWALPMFGGGQSNEISIVAPVTTALPDATIKFGFNTPPSGDSGGLWVALQVDPVTGNSGCEIRFCQILKALGFDIGFAKLAHGATTGADWVPGIASDNFELDIRPRLTQLVQQMNTVWPGQFSRWSATWALGEDDARAAGLGATQYRDNLLKTLIGISGIVGQNVWKWFFPVRTQSWLGGAIANCLADIRSYQMQMATGGHFIDSDGFTHLGDNVHYDALVTGQPAYGTALATAWQAVVPVSAP